MIEILTFLSRKAVYFKVLSLTFLYNLRLDIGGIDDSTLKTSLVDLQENILNNKTIKTHPYIKDEFL